MIGKVIEIGKTSVEVELTIDDNQKKNIINFHVAFDTDNTTVNICSRNIKKTILLISL